MLVRFPALPPALVRATHALALTLHHLSRLLSNNLTDRHANEPRAVHPMLPLVAFVQMWATSCRLHLHRICCLTPSVVSLPWHRPPLLQLLRLLLDDGTTTRWSTFSLANSSSINSSTTGRRMPPRTAHSYARNALRKMVCRSALVLVFKRRGIGRRQIGGGVLFLTGTNTVSESRQYQLLSIERRRMDPDEPRSVRRVRNSPWHVFDVQLSTPIRGTEDRRFSRVGTIARLLLKAVRRGRVLPDT